MDTDQDILWLDIAMNDMLLVEVLQRRCHLGNVLRGLPFREPLLAPEVLVQLSFAGIFKDQEDALTIVKMTEHPQTIGVCQIRLDLNLATDLLFYLALLELGFVKYLERADEARRSLSCQIHSSEFAFSKWLANFEHAEMPLSWSGWLRSRFRKSFYFRLPLNI